MPTFPKGHANKPTHTANAKLIGTLAPPSQTAPGTVKFYAYTAADEHTLRGIPAIGRGCPGRIPGSRPDAICDRNPSPH